MFKVLLTLFLISVFFLASLCPSASFAKKSRFGFVKDDPTHSLQRSFPPAEDWSLEKLTRAMVYAQEAGSTALVVLHKGRLVAEWGKTTWRIKSHSVRKSLLSALYGIAVNRKLIDLSSTLTDLGIDDRHPCLSPRRGTLFLN
jgi:hypothetical protein